MSKFVFALSRELLRNVCERYGTDNWSYSRFGRPRGILKRKLMAQMAALLRRVDLGIVVFNGVEAGYDDLVGKYGEGLGRLYDMLGDEASKEMLVKVIAFRILGYRRLRLPVNCAEYWQKQKQAQSLRVGKATIRGTFEGRPLHLLALDAIGFPGRLYGSPAGIAGVFLLGQYEYENVRPGIAAGPGDCVIDGGGCWGDTALYFSLKVGPSGRVYTFEFVPENLDILQTNLAQNEELAKRIDIVQHALWSTSGHSLSYLHGGPASHVSDSGAQGNGSRVFTKAIDDLVAEGRIPKVDFIKLDIEGAELEALRGAQKTILAQRPKLAISLYHKLEDFVSIPAYLCSLGIDYEYYLGHYTIHGEETVLFARPKL